MKGRADACQNPNTKHDRFIRLYGGKKTDLSVIMLDYAERTLFVTGRSKGDCYDRAIACFCNCTVDNCHEKGKIGIVLNKRQKLKMRQSRNLKQ